MKKLVFIIDDRATGGVVSALSGLYDVIKNDYNISVIELSTYGSSITSYDEVCIKPSFLCDGFFSDFTNAVGYPKVRAFIARLWAFTKRNPISALVDRYSTVIKSADCIIAFCEGKVTVFANQIKHKNKIAWIHYDISNATQYPFNNKINTIYEHYDKIVCVAEKIACGMRLMYPLLGNKIYSIHNVVEEARIKSLALLDVNEKFSECINIISLGRIVELKRFSKIPFIAKTLKDKGVVFKWRILGPAVRIEEKERLLEEIAKYNLEEEVVWLGPIDNPYPYILKSDVLVSTSESEACPMIFEEARLLNAVIVTANFTTASEFVDNHIDGVCTSIEQMPNELLKLALDRNYYNRLLSGSQGRSAGKSNYLEEFNRLIDNN